MYSPRKTNTKLDASLKLGEEAERKDKGRGSVTNGWLGKCHSTTTPCPAMQLGRRPPDRNRALNNGELGTEEEGPLLSCKH